MLVVATPNISNGDTTIMKLTWDGLTFGTIQPAARAAKTLEEKQENICKTLDEAKTAFNNGQPHRSIRDRGDDTFEISNWFSTSRIPLHDDGRNCITVKDRKQVIPVLDLLQKETRAGRFSATITALSQKRSAARKTKVAA
jgi:hypothetical protein